MFDEPGLTDEDTTPRAAISLDEKLRQEEPPIVSDDTNPSRTFSLDEKLRQEEPPIVSDDTNPSRTFSLEERLRQEEPPIVSDDTNPSRTFSLDERLRQEEPPIAVDDTSPARVRVPARPGRLQRLTGVSMLVGAAVLTLVATAVWMDSDGSSDTLSGASVNQPAPESTSAPVVVIPVQPKDDPQSQPVMVALAEPQIFPTAAADEIASALLNPVPDAQQARVIQRENEPFTIGSASARAGMVKYTVQKGDTLETIASKFELADYYTLVWSNPTNKVNPLRAGVELNIMPEDGVYYEITDTITIGAVAEEFSVDPYAIIDSEYNNLFGSNPDTLLVPSMGGVIVPGGKSERDIVLPANTSGTASYSGGGGSISGPYSLWGCNSTISGGTLPVSRPLDSYTWMQGFVAGGHTGVDLSPKMGTGTPVHAAGAGTVVYAGGNSGGYGNVVVIGHGMAFSLYAHLQNYSVSCGQSVSAGQTIGAAGSTGNSSGPHLHFEVRDADFNLRNPADYVGF